MAVLPHPNHVRHDPDVILLIEPNHHQASLVRNSIGGYGMI
jgi:hypothetical protein